MPEPIGAFPVRVTEKVVAAAGVAVFELARPDGGPLPGWAPGAHIDLELRPGMVRQYSLCSDPAQTSTWRIGVLLEPDGRGGSRYLHEAVQPGTVLRARGPRNTFALASADRYLFIAGGIGITALLPMVGAVPPGSWRLCYGGRTRESMAFTAELASLGAAVTVSPQDEVGLLDLPGLLDGLPTTTAVYCCGPSGLLEAVQTHCERLGLTDLHLERFAPVAAEPRPRGSFEVELASSGQVLTVDPDETLLESLELAGSFVDSSCREGTCGACEIAVLDGVPEHRDSVLGAAERAAGKVIMACVSRAEPGRRLLLDL